MATPKQYSDLASSINQALSTAGITALTFTTKTDEVINTVTYANILDHEGSHLQSDADKVEKILDEAFGKLGSFTVVKSPARVIVPPADPSDDHYQIVYGYYLDEKDLPQDAVDEKKLNDSINKIAQSNATQVTGTTKQLKYTTVSKTSDFNITDPDMSGDRTITINTTVVVNKPV